MKETLGRSCRYRVACLSVTFITASLSPCFSVALSFSLRLSAFLFSFSLTLYNAVPLYLPLPAMMLGTPPCIAPLPVATLPLSPCRPPPHDKRRSARLDAQVILPLYPQFSISTSGSSLRVLNEEFTRRPEQWGHKNVVHTVVPSYHDRPGYVNAMAALVAKEVAQYTPEQRMEGVQVRV